MNRYLTLYAVGIVLTFICAGLYLKNAHGETREPVGGFPSSAPGTIIGHVPDQAKPCSAYLTRCEKSCLSREGLFRFSCLGPDYNPDAPRYRCQCGDEAFQVQVVQAKPEKEAKSDAKTEPTTKKADK